MNSIKQNDLNYGLQKETEIFDILKENLDNTLEKSKNKFLLFSFNHKEIL